MICNPTIGEDTVLASDGSPSHGFMSPSPAVPYVDEAKSSLARIPVQSARRGRRRRGVEHASPARPRGLLERARRAWPSSGTRESRVLRSARRHPAHDGLRWRRSRSRPPRWPARSDSDPSRRLASSSPECARLRPSVARLRRGGRRRVPPPTGDDRYRLRHREDSRTGPKGLPAGASFLDIMGASYGTGTPRRLRPHAADRACQAINAGRARDGRSILASPKGA